MVVFDIELEHINASISIFSKDLQMSTPFKMSAPCCMKHCIPSLTHVLSICVSGKETITNVCERSQSWVDRLRITYRQAYHIRPCLRGHVKLDVALHVSHTFIDQYCVDLPFETHFVRTSPLRKMFVECLNPCRLAAARERAQQLIIFVAVPDRADSSRKTDSQLPCHIEQPWTNAIPNQTD